jgi:hypothetical protein
MRSRIRNLFFTRRGHGPWILASALLVALLVAPFAGAFGEGTNVRGGARNPSADARKAYTKETQIIANVSTYGTRQSNKSNNGGGAVYGCRSAAGGTPKGNEPCLRASNLSNGRAFEFNANGGTEVGAITGPANAAPFTTTAKGVATGLNADQVDGKNASDIVTDAQASNMFATVTGTTGALGVNRGATSSSRASAGVYNVVFGTDVSKCSRTVTVAGTDPATATTDIGANAQTVVVHTFGFTASPPPPADQSFNLTVTC